MKRSLAILAALAIAIPSGAQKRNQEPEQQPLVERIDVRIINVDVVVTDRKGNPVPNLTADDFTILENGVAKPISNFYEVQGSEAKNVLGEPPAPEPATPAAPVKKEIPEAMKRRILFYVDNLSLSPFNRNRVFQQMKDFVNEVMRPGDEAMIATYNRSMKVRVPFTRDTAQILSMLDSLQKESGLGIANKSERRTTEDRIREAQSYNDAIATARSYASSIEHDLRQSVASINALMSTLAGVEGKKILVLTSEGFPMQPGREMFYFIEDVGREKGWSNVGSTMLEGMTFDGANLIQSVAKTANANGITMYTVHAAGLTGGTEMSAENAQPISASVSQAASSNTTESMQLMAEMTGGVASVQTNNFKAAFERIHQDLESYYSLGYRAGTERVDRQRYLQVRMKNKEYRVRNRQTFVEKSVFAEMSDKVVANLLYRMKDNDLGILTRVGTPLPTEDGYYHVPVDIQIPMHSLELLPQGDAEYVGGFDVYVVVANKNNDMSDVARKAHQVRVPAAMYKELTGKFYTYTLELLMERGLNKISVGVVDQVDNTSGFARDQVIAQDMR
ncbi:MAG TPA: VWA domain-containing protein [Thermoanaerobaculia bacterium]|nr:VWA domain-containing protein [Thermoanaerobaculia bacterium]